MTTRIGILGFAHGHVGMYCGQWKQMDDARVIAGWDHDAARAKAACEPHGIAIDATIDALLARRDIDAVVIAAETSMHADLVERAAAAGKAIVLQKPLALTLAEADRIVTAVEKSGVPFTLAWQMRVDPQNAKMRDMIRDGTIGRVLMFRRRHGLGTHTWKDFDKSWHVQPELNRGMWADDASHPIDMLYWMFGTPVSVTAEIDTLVNPKIPDDNGIAIFRYSDGMMAEIGCSFTCVAGENTTEIVGEKGVVIQNFGDAVSCTPARPKDAIGLKWFLQEKGQWIDSDIPSPPTHAARISGLARPLLDFLQGKREPLATAREGRDVLRITLACYESAKQGKRVLF